MGAWIETKQMAVVDAKMGSHPTWVRGLKLDIDIAYVGEIGRTLHGCVD